RDGDLFFTDARHDIAVLGIPIERGASPDQGEKLAAEIVFTGGVSGHDPLGSGNDGNAHASEHLGNLLATHVATQTGATHPLETLQRGDVPGIAGLRLELGAGAL